MAKETKIQKDTASFWAECHTEMHRIGFNTILRTVARSAVPLARSGRALQTGAVLSLTLGASALAFANTASAEEKRE